jgi:hypothetical protein
VLLLLLLLLLLLRLLGSGVSFRQETLQGSA